MQGTALCVDIRMHDFGHESKYIKDLFLDTAWGCGCCGNTIQKSIGAKTIGQGWIHMRTKVFAAYLPQYHEIPENNNFWGKGYTDWVATKNALPQFEGHIQPRVPLNENYYHNLNRC